MLYPIVGLLLALVIVPIVYVVDTSLYRQNLFQALPPRFVGFDNYSYLFRSSTFEVSLCAARLCPHRAHRRDGAGFLLAAWIFRLRHLPGMAIVRTVMTMPILVAPVVAAVMWRFMYQPDFGIINYALRALGLPASDGCRTRASRSFRSRMIDVWQWTPFVFLTVLAGMYGIPEQYYEAAELDGTDLWRQTFFITIPLLKRVLIIVLLLRLIDLLRAFEIIVATTQGGPGDASYTLPVLIWETAFVSFEIGDAAAASVVLLFSSPC